MMGAGTPPAQGEVAAPRATLEECGTPRGQQGPPSAWSPPGLGLSPISSPAWCLWGPGSDSHQRGLLSNLQAVPGPPSWLSRCSCRGLSGTSGGLPSAATPSLHPGGAAGLHGSATVGFTAHGFTGAYPHSSIHSFIPRLPTLCLAQDSGLGSGNSFTGKRSRHPNLRVTETKRRVEGKGIVEGIKNRPQGKRRSSRARSPRLLAAQLPSALGPAAKRKPAERRVRSPRAKLSARCSLSLPTMAWLMVKGHLMLQKKQRRRVVGAGAGRAHVRC